MRVPASSLAPFAASLALVAGCKFAPGGTGAPQHDMVMGGGHPTAVVTATPAPVGLPTVLDGSGSSDSRKRTLSYAWHIASVPSGSTVDDHALSAGGATVNFAGDRGGDYGVELTVTAPDGSSGKATATVTIPTLPLFFRQSRIAADGDSFVFGVVRSDGSGARAVGCVTTVADPSHGDAGAGNRATYGDTPGTVGLRQLDGNPAKVVFEEVTAGGHQLFASDENGDCNARPPVRLDATMAAQHLFPRFSADGTRVAWVDVGTPSQLYTAALDGSGRHLVRTGAGKIKNAPPVWIDATHVAWVEDASTTMTPHLQILQAQDGDGAAATALLDCDAATDATALQVIDQFALPGGTLVVAGGTRTRTVNPPGATLLYAMAQGSCSTTQATVLMNEPMGGFAWDFDVAPDGSAIVFAAAESPGSSLHDIYKVLLGGTSPPLASRFVGSQPGVDDIGPRFIAGGKQLAWTEVVGDASSGGLVVANYDGTAVRTVLGASADGGTKTYLLGGVNRGLDCSAAGPRSTFADAMLIMLALCLRRRRR